MPTTNMKTIPMAMTVKVEVVRLKLHGGKRKTEEGDLQWDPYISTALLRAALLLVKSKTNKRAGGGKTNTKTATATGNSTINRDFQILK